jgi:hypothetical protein
MEAQAGATPKALALGYHALGSAQWLPNARDVVALVPRSIEGTPRPRPRTERRSRRRRNRRLPHPARRSSAKAIRRRPRPPTAPGSACCCRKVDRSRSILPRSRSFRPREAASRRSRRFSTARSRRSSGPPTATRSCFPTSMKADSRSPGSDWPIVPIQLLTARADWGIRAFDLDRTHLVQVVTHPGNPFGTPPRVVSRRRQPSSDDPQPTLDLRPTTRDARGPSAGQLRRTRDSVLDHAPG